MKSTQFIDEEGNVVPKPRLIRQNRKKNLGDVSIPKGIDTPKRNMYGHFTGFSEQSRVELKNKAERENTN